MARLIDALQMTFSTLLDIVLSPNFRCFDKNGVFQQPLRITPSERSRTILQRHYASCALLTPDSRLANAFGASSASECVARSAGRGLALRVPPMLFMPAAQAA